MILRKKGFVSIILAACFVFGLFAVGIRAKADSACCVNDEEDEIIYGDSGSTGDNPFSDVKAGKYYTEAVLWAVNASPQITSGTSPTKFEPNLACNRAQVVTFIWRMMGCQEPKTTVNPFTDVKPSHYYYKAVLWAVENDITTGTSKTNFSPKDVCNRAQFVTFFWRACGCPVPTGDLNPFVDVKSGKYYSMAVKWASENEITTGTDATHFSPLSDVSRGQAVTFLFRGRNLIDTTGTRHKHNWILEESVDATCTTDGKKTYKCSCGDSYTETIPSKGHSWGDTWEEEGDDFGTVIREEHYMGYDGIDYTLTYGGLLEAMPCGWRTVTYKYYPEGQGIEMLVYHSCSSCGKTELVKTYRIYFDEPGSYRYN